MKFKDILVTGVTGTTFMTLFSYLVSAADNENYSEPERLGQLIHRLVPVAGKKDHQLIGWGAHYAVGLAFATAYVKLWDEKKIKRSFKNNLLLGLISGLVAVAIWKTTFKLHPLPPKLSFDKYYLQLIPAHIVFALFAELGYHLLNKNKSSAQADINNEYHKHNKLHSLVM